MSKNYKVIYSPQALQDITEIYEYICFILQNPLAAKNLSSRIRQTIRSLNTMPLRHPLVTWEPWNSLEMHQVPIDNFTVFYRVDKENAIVTIIRIFYAGRDVQNISKNM